MLEFQLAFAVRRVVGRGHLRPQCIATEQQPGAVGLLARLH
jgi:hypothetical protein